MLVSLSLGAQAQTQPQDTTMNRTVVVEQEYNPDIMDASKVNVLPKVEPPTVSKKAVEYDATLMPATHIPAGIMQAYTGKETQAKALPGYVRLGYGNYGNLDVRANYLFSLSPKDRLNLTFTMDGMDGKLDLPDNGGKWNSFYYRTHAAMDYVHAFSKVDLNIAGKFNQSNFNFLPNFVSNKQKFVSGDVHFGVAFRQEDAPPVLVRYDMSEVGPAFLADVDRGTQVHALGFQRRAHLAPPVHELGLPALQCALQPAVRAEVDVVRDLGFVVDALGHGVHTRFLSKTACLPVP